MIPALLLDDASAVKTRGFADPAYLGDIVNTASIFNSKEVDELVVFDIGAWKRGSINFDLIRVLGQECFMPLCYGGGITRVDEAAQLLRGGVEKIAVNRIFNEEGGFVADAARAFGSSSIVVCIDVVATGRDTWEVRTRSGTRRLNVDPFDQARRAVDAGAGEIIIQSIDRDGMRGGYDCVLVARMAKAVSVPVIAMGGAGSAKHMVEAINGAGIESVAAGSLFVQYGRHLATLVTYLNETDRRAVSEAVVNSGRKTA